MVYYIAFFFLASLTSFFLTPWAIWLAKKLQAIRYPPSLMRDKVKGVHRIIAYRRHLEKPPTPLMGGLAYVVTFFIAVAVGMVVSNQINFFPKDLASYAMWFAGAVALFILGIVDDIYDLPGVYQFSVHIFAITLFMLSSFDIIMVHVPFLGNVYVNWLVLKPTSYISLVIPGDLIAGILIYFLLFGLKLQAGIDGLMEGSTAIGLLFVFINAYLLGHYVAAFMAIVLAGALLGFWFYNAHPSVVFSGSTGKSVIGYLVATLAIIGEAKFSVILGAFALPILDMFYVLFKRFLKYKNIKKMFIISDRTHFHYRLMALGLNEWQINIFEYIYTFLAGLVLTLTPSSYKTLSLVLVWGITIGTILYVNAKSYNVRATR